LIGASNHTLSRFNHNVGSLNAGSISLSCLFSRRLGSRGSLGSLDLGSVHALGSIGSLDLGSVHALGSIGSLDLGSVHALGSIGSLDLGNVHALISLVLSSSDQDVSEWFRGINLVKAGCRDSRSHS